METNKELLSNRISQRNNFIIPNRYNGERLESYNDRFKKIKTDKNKTEILNSRLNRFSPLANNSNYPIMNQKVNFDNKPINTRIFENN